MFGTFWIWYRSSFTDSNGVPMYSNIVKNENMRFTLKVRQSRSFQLQISEEQFLTKTSIQKADNGISEAFTSSTLKTQSFYKNDYPTLLQNGYNHKLSGNVCYIYNPAWMDYSEKGEGEKTYIVFIDMHS